MPVVFWKGKPLFVKGKVAMSKNCCCGPSTCPACESTIPNNMLVTLNMPDKDCSDCEIWTDTWTLPFSACFEDTSDNNYWKARFVDNYDIEFCGDSSITIVCDIGFHDFWEIRKAVVNLRAQPSRTEWWTFRLMETEVSSPFDCTAFNNTSLPLVAADNDCDWETATCSITASS